MGALSHQKIRDIRKRKGLTMQALADAVGTSQQQIDRLEKGHRKLTLDWLERLAQALGCSVLELLPPSAQRDGGERIAKAKVIGEVSADGIIRWWPEEDRYTLMFGRPNDLRNGRLFAVKVGGDGEDIGFSSGTELVFSETGEDGLRQKGIQDGWAICTRPGGVGEEIHCVEKLPSATDIRAIRARLVKSLRNE